VDDVITAHDAYLSEVLDRALLAPHHEELNLQIQQLLHIVLRFCNLEETLIAGTYESAVVFCVSFVVLQDQFAMSLESMDSDQAVCDTTGTLFDKQYFLFLFLFSYSQMRWPRSRAAKCPTLPLTRE